MQFTWWSTIHIRKSCKYMPRNSHSPRPWGQTACACLRILHIEKVKLLHRNKGRPLGLLTARRHKAKEANRCRMVTTTYKNTVKAWRAWLTGLPVCHEPARLKRNSDHRASNKKSRTFLLTRGGERCQRTDDDRCVVLSSHKRCFNTNALSSS